MNYQKQWAANELPPESIYGSKPVGAYLLLADNVHVFLKVVGHVAYQTWRNMEIELCTFLL